MKLTFEDVLRAESRLRAASPWFEQPTPTFRSPALSELFDADIWLKVESVGPIASFKLRGALNALLTWGDRPVSAVTSSTGNHGQGVAYAAGLLGIPADIFVPDGCVPEKLAAIKRLGGRLFVGGLDIDDAKDRARIHAERTGGAFIDDGENAQLIAGAGTVGLEAARALPAIDVVLVPMGSGSLVSGVALGLKGLQSTAQVWAVQSEGSPAMVESYHAGHAVERLVDTIADCLVCRVPARLALDMILELVDDAFLVSDENLRRAIHTVAMRGRVLAEPGAVAGLAGAWARREELRNRTVLIVVTGANVSESVLVSALAGKGLEASAPGRVRTRCA